LKGGWLGIPIGCSVSMPECLKHGTRLNNIYLISNSLQTCFTGILFGILAILTGNKDLILYHDNYLCAQRDT
jgi:hypothetical protein